MLNERQGPKAMRQKALIYEILPVYPVIPVEYVNAGFHIEVLNKSKTRLYSKEKQYVERKF